MSPAPVILRFHYHEVMDRDHALIRLEVLEDGVVTHVFTNLPESWEDAPKKEAYANQREDFVFPTREAAVAMIHSNPEYRPMVSTLERYFSAERE